MELIKEIAEMRGFAEAARDAAETIVLVPTMGFLHDGHRSLMRLAKAYGSTVVLSIFVNPAQFGVNDDYASYPRDPEADLAVALEEVVDAVFVPSVAQMYPDGYRTYVEVERLGENLCGANRPRHFRGVTTVVLKLFNLVLPHKAVFGRKDFQQLRIIEKMTEDLNLGVTIIGGATVREEDGLAMSSRNVYLSSEERAAASVIPRALEAVYRAYAAGERDGAALVRVAEELIAAEPLAELEYVKVCDPETLKDISEIEEKAIVALAVRFGHARLIDNLELGDT